MVERGSSFLCREPVLDAAARTVPDGGTFGAALPAPPCRYAEVDESVPSRITAANDRSKGLLDRLPGSRDAAIREKNEGRSGVFRAREP